MTNTNNFSSWLKCDLTNDQDVMAALRGADCVFHLASYGMSGNEQVMSRALLKRNSRGGGAVG